MTNAKPESDANVRDGKVTGSRGAKPANCSWAAATLTDPAGESPMRLFARLDEHAAVDRPAIEEFGPKLSGRRMSYPQLRDTAAGFAQNLSGLIEPGQVKQIDHAVDGATLTFERTVLRGGETLIDESITSKYVPWRNVFRFGPGFQPPAGAEVAPVPLAQ